MKFGWSKWNVPKFYMYDIIAKEYRILNFIRTIKITTQYISKTTAAK